MRSINRVMLMGHLAADPDLRQTENGRAVASFPVATNRFVKNEEGEKQEIADFHRIVAWNGLAGLCGKYLVKGMAVFIEGRLINRSFEDKKGNRHYRTEIVVEELNIITWKKTKSGDNLGVEKVSDQEEQVDELTEDEKAK